MTPTCSSIVVFYNFGVYPSITALAVRLKRRGRWFNLKRQETCTRRLKPEGLTPARSTVPTPGPAHLRVAYPRDLEVTSNQTVTRTQSACHLLVLGPKRPARGAYLFHYSHVRGLPPVGGAAVPRAARAYGTRAQKTGGLISAILTCQTPHRPKVIRRGGVKPVRSGRIVSKSDTKSSPPMGLNLLSAVRRCGVRCC